MPEIALAFLWHQHQPYYPDDVGGENPLPWVRMHGVKDYYGMAAHLRAVPEMRCTINLVPSLLVQIQGYTERGASDRFLDVARIPADDLTENDCLFLLDHFFMANPDHLIRPHPRYAELHHRRAANRGSAREAMRRFNERDYRDLQVWFNLAWVHPLAVEKHSGLQELLKKGRHFTEADKQHLLKTHIDILRELIPMHRQLAESGQVELTTTPFYHPILPLLLDKKYAREAMPEVKLPRHTGGYPEDAALHLRRAVEQHREIFGSAPTGMWPAEGSVCHGMIPLVAQHGIRWIATDEHILHHSMPGALGRDAKGHVRNPEKMYRPYKIVEGGHELNIVFRDHALSDMIGFHYQRSEPGAAADDLLRHVEAIGEAVSERGTPGEKALVSIILDGENCWEHYSGGGVTFLRTLYERCTQSKKIKPVKIGEHLEKHPPRDTLPRLFAGSWINHNFAIWVGHEEDNTGWDLLHRTREHLLRRSQESGARSQESGAGEDSGKPSLTPDSRLLTPVQKAWQELYIAEGSDWFWWYGEDHFTVLNGVFDYLFRKHLQNVYLLLGEQPPPDLARPISRRGHRPIHTVPRSFLQVKIDGRATFFEWINAGHYTAVNERGTMAQATQGPLKELHFGFDLERLFVRVDCENNARDELAGLELRIGFLDPAGHELRIQAGTKDRPLRFELLHEEKPTDARGVEVAIGPIVEAAIPWARLGVAVNQSVQFYVDVVEGGQSRDRAPREGIICLPCPGPDFEHIMWDVMF
jgi:alpha-amylase/alpha-mannosidase (GH57 family)